MRFTVPSLQKKLQEAPPVVFSIFVIIAAFCTYSCMYMFRKPYAVGTFDGMGWGDLEYKTVLIITQVAGYALSKFMGIKIISEMTGGKRALSILVLIGISWVGLLLLAVIPYPWNFLAMFLNGLPLGMVWGLVFSYLEGRKTTELLGAGLAVSFIFASGFAKTVGKYLMLEWGVSEFWMPFSVGAIFIVPLFLFVFMLDQIPPPSDEDKAERTERLPMNGAQRKAFFKTFAPGLILLVLVYVLLTSYRDFRDNFAAEMFESLGYGETPSIFTLTEIPVGIGVMVIMAMTMAIKDNLKALLFNHYLIAGGLLIAGIGTFAFQAGWISAPLWMILTGFGTYIGYIPFNIVIFERLIATFKYVSNAGFLIYLADSFGYLGSVGVLLYKNFGQSEMSWVNFFTNAGYILAAIGLVLMVASAVYFRKKAANWGG